MEWARGKFYPGLVLAIGKAYVHALYAVSLLFVRVGTESEVAKAAEMTGDVEGN